MKKLLLLAAVVALSIHAFAASAANRSAAEDAVKKELPFDYLSLVDMTQVNTAAGDRNTGVEFVIPEDALI
jgi:ethanolamine ammonia-lyase small subunit